MIQEKQDDSSESDFLYNIVRDVLDNVFVEKYVQMVILADHLAQPHQTGQQTLRHQTWDVFHLVVKINVFVVFVCNRAIIYVEEDDFWFHENVTNGDVSHVVENSVVEQSRYIEWVELNFKYNLHVANCSKYLIFSKTIFIISIAQTG